MLFYSCGDFCFSVGVQIKTCLQRMYKWPKEGSEWAKSAGPLSEARSPFEHFRVNTALGWFDRLPDEHGTLR